MIAFDTTIGTCGVTWSEVGLTGVRLPGSRLMGAERGIDGGDVPQTVRDAIAGMTALLDGERVDLLDIVLDERLLGDFHRRVYAVTREVGAGHTATYGEIARGVGAPGAARAVGAALGENPYPIVVPCHRVLAADGSLHGFSAPGGIRTKRRMLEIEAAPGFNQAALFS